MTTVAMLPLLIVALLIWAGVWAYLWSVDRRVRALEQRLTNAARRSEESR